jgi:beta-galactosidase
MPEVSKDKAVVNVDYYFSVCFFSGHDKKVWQMDVWNSKPTAKKITVRSIIYDKNGNEIARTETENEYANFKKDYKLTQKIALNNPNLWSSDTPVLYNLKSQLECEGKIIDDQVRTTECL